MWVWGLNLHPLRSRKNQMVLCCGKAWVQAIFFVGWSRQEGGEERKEECKRVVMSSYHYVDVGPNPAGTPERLWGGAQLRMSPEGHGGGVSVFLVQDCSGGSDSWLSQTVHVSAAGGLLGTRLP